MRFSVALAVAAVTPVLASACGGSGDPGLARSAGRAEGSRGTAEAAQPVRTVLRKRTVYFVDRSRSTSRTPVREFTTIVRYTERRQGDRTLAPEPRPLLLFVHGFALDPSDYRPLLSGWARAGYVVAAPRMPLEWSGAPGGPARADLVNQPRDVRFLISKLLDASRRRSGPLAGRIDTSRVAVAGHSDGGDTVLSAAFDPQRRDRRIDAVVVLAGAFIPTPGPFTFPDGGPPLLAVQGTKDPVNVPAATDAFFARATQPKYRLDLLGAGHYGPYERQSPQVGLVRRMTTKFLDRYVAADKGVTEAALLASGRRSGVARVRR